MAEGRSVFQPLEAKDMIGPFSGWLRPPEPSQFQQQVQQSPAPIGTLGGIASAAGALIEGASQGRRQRFEQQENDKIQGWNRLNSYMQNNVWNNPDLDRDGIAAANQIYNQAVGHYGADALGKEAKGGKAGKDGPQSFADHALGAVRSVVTGLVGGQMPKGAPNPGDTMARVQGAIFGGSGKPLPQFDRNVKIAGVLAEARKNLEGVPAGSYVNVAQRAISPQIDKLLVLAGTNAPHYVSNLLGPYQEAPAPGSPAEVNRAKMGILGIIPGTPTTSGVTAPATSPGPPPAPDLVSGMPRQQLTIQPNVAPGQTLQYSAGETPQYPPPSPAPPPAPAGQTPARGYDPTRAAMFESLNMGATDKPKNIAYTDKATGKTRTTSAIFVNNAEFQGWVDTQSGRPIQASGDIRAVPDTQQRDRFELRDLPGADKKLHRVLVDKDEEGKVVKDYGVIPDKPESEYQRATLDMRRGLVFQNQENHIYQDYQSKLTSIEIRAQGMISSITGNSMLAPEDKEKGINQANAWRESQVREQDKMIKDRLDVLYKQQNKEFHTGTPAPPPSPGGPKPTADYIRGKFR